MTTELTQEEKDWVQERMDTLDQAIPAEEFLEYLRQMHPLDPKSLH